MLPLFKPQLGQPPSTLGRPGARRLLKNHPEPTCVSNSVEVQESSMSLRFFSFQSFSTPIPTLLITVLYVVGFEVACSIPSVLRDVLTPFAPWPVLLGIEEVADDTIRPCR